MGQLVKIIVAACFLLAAAACKPGKAFVKSTDALPRTYFRVTADYKVKATQEIIKFDYVVTCGGRITNWSYTSPSVLHTLHPQVMLMPTSTGEAIGVDTPRMCSGRHWAGNQDFPIPDDFMPLTYWYPDVASIGFAIGYVSDLAYESPYSKLEFLGSTLELSNRRAWEAWREKSAAEYKEAGVIPGPWGYSGALAEKVKEVNHGQPIAHRECYGATRLDLPDEVREDALAFVPEDAGRFWASGVVSFERSRELYKVLGYRHSDRNTHIYNGGEWHNHKDDSAVGSRPGGVRRSDGKLITGSYPSRTWTEGGALNSSGFGNYYHDTFPVIYTRPLSATAAEDISERSPQNLRTAELIVKGEDFREQNFRGVFERVVLAQDDWNGFNLCGHAALTEESLVAYSLGEVDRVDFNYSDAKKLEWLSRTAAASVSSKYAREYGEWGFRFKVNDQMIAQGDQNVLGQKRMDIIIDQEGYVFPNCCRNR